VDGSLKLKDELSEFVVESPSNESARFFHVVNELVVNLNGRPYGRAISSEDGLHLNEHELYRLIGQADLSFDDFASLDAYPLRYSTHFHERLVYGRNHNILSRRRVNDHVGAAESHHALGPNTRNLLT